MLRFNKILTNAISINKKLQQGQEVSPQHMAFLKGVRKIFKGDRRLYE
jgi:hypothetical protein